MAENMFEISPDGKTLKVVAIGKYEETMVVPDGVQKIAREAFRKNLAYGGDVLKKVVLPRRIEDHWNWCFQQMQNARRYQSA